MNIWLFQTKQMNKTAQVKGGDQNVAEITLSITTKEKIKQNLKGEK